MMQLSVDWMQGYRNNPKIHVTGATKQVWPEGSNPAWINREGMHVAVQAADVVHYFYTDGKPTQGYGGRRFSGTFTNGDRFDYTGAWSSRAGVVNILYPSAKIVDVVLDKYTACAVLADRLIAAWRVGEYDFGLAWVTEENGECTLYPTRKGRLKNEPYTGSRIEHLVK